MTNGNIRTRDGLERTFRAACTASTTAGIPLNTAGAAGLLLAIFGSAADARDAARRMPPGDVWSEAARYLDELANEETCDTQRPKAAGATGR